MFPPLATVSDLKKQVFFFFLTVICCWYLYIYIYIFFFVMQVSTLLIILCSFLVQFLVICCWYSSFSNCRYVDVWYISCASCQLPNLIEKSEGESHEVTGPFLVISPEAGHGVYLLGWGWVPRCEVTLFKPICFISRLHRCWRQALGSGVWHRRKADGLARSDQAQANQKTWECFRKWPKQSGCFQK